MTTASAAAEQCVREGRLQDALTELQQLVRADPASSRYRVFLFQLLVVLGEWERALNQLAVVAEMDAATLPMAQTYREMIHCERLRAEVFAGTRQPLLFGEPAEWLALLLEALKATADERHEQAAALRERAFDAAPASAGRVDGQTFAWIADADPRLGPVFEAMINGRYYWVPFSNVRSITFETPTDLRDLVWAPVNFVWSNGGETVGLTPSRYPGSERSDDNAIRLARRTDWRDVGDGVQLGSGQRLLATDADDYPLLTVQSIEFDVGDGDGDGDGDGSG